MLESPMSLVAILVAARRTRDLDLERAARHELEERFGMRIVFTKNGPVDRESKLISKGETK